MMSIPCPFCGPRDETEFGYGGEAGVDYPERPADLDDEAWSDYLFIRDNPRGWFRERWVHRAGCRQWFVVTRHTATNEIAPVGRTS
ncbi:sarcosine oxidase subunit delta [Aeromicrobium sp.]|uniref:sarcosine oxidase subunit delta n=1 Tax=Aeromicrobium sp. TaxID=1871063 RepID=UPI0019B54FDB|nr:sarcosine oxidase subunit delta [Aeromicrobium sp.]MBC7631185.1 sarcosine oxidase subunit delta [Aeromicrobium sp.]